MFERVDGELGTLDVLVNNAGVSGGRKGRVDELDEDEAMSMLAINVVGPLLVLARGDPSHVDAARRTRRRHRQPVLRRREDRRRRTQRALRREQRRGRRDDARARARSRGGGHSRQRRAPRRHRHRKPAARARRRNCADDSDAAAGLSSEVAQAVLWLASDDASYVTGTIVDVTGGR